MESSQDNSVHRQTMSERQQRFASSDDQLTSSNANNTPSYMVGYSSIVVLVAVAVPSFISEAIHPVIRYGVAAVAVVAVLFLMLDNDDIGDDPQKQSETKCDTNGGGISPIQDDGTSSSGTAGNEDEGNNEQTSTMADSTTSEAARSEEINGGEERNDEDYGNIGSSSNNTWRCACENGFLPPGLLKTFGGAEAMMRLGTGQCYHKG